MADRALESSFKDVSRSRSLPMKRAVPSSAIPA